MSLFSKANLYKIVRSQNTKIICIAFFIFIFSVVLRLWNIGGAGRWSDEAALVEKGYTFAELAKHKDFSNPFWYKEASDHPPLAMYFYGLASYKDFIKNDKNTPASFSFFWDNAGGTPVFNYDLTYTRLVSVLVSSLAVLLAFFIGLRYFSLFTGVASSLILAMIPHYLAFSQMVTYESFVITFFTACVFCYLLYLEKNKKYLLVLTGILTGLTLEVKESTVLILPFFVGTYFIWKKLTGKKNIKWQHFIALGIAALFTYIIVWPMPWFHLPEYTSRVYDLWFKNEGLIPDLMFGRQMGAHFFYYFVAFLVTTPVIILFLTGWGLKFALSQRKKWIFSVLILWFSVPFLMLFFHHRAHMVRYIVEIFVPVAILSAIGLESIVKKFSKKRIDKYLALLPVLAYLLIILINLTPFYEEYYNELVGGTKNVYANKLFFIGWFGEGLKEPGVYIASHANKNSLVGLATDPYSFSAVYKVPSLRYEKFNPKHRYDYIMVNYYIDIRLGFDESSLKKDYELVFTEKANGADFVHVYKHK